jgi:hypothetical protein
MLPDSKAAKIDRYECLEKITSIWVSMVACFVDWTSSLLFVSLFCAGLGAFQLSLDSGVAVEGQQEKFSMVFVHVKLFGFPCFFSS